MRTEAGNNQKLLTVSEIQNWLVSYIAKILEVASDEIDIKVIFDEYGLDSSMAVTMIADLEARVGCTLDPTLIYEYPTIEKLARYVSEV
ncbi:acyl carrier protein [Nostoc sp. UHCC 0702]|nr:acyl carrier protein [Nostoc sp. UHCC 0702]